MRRRTSNHVTFQRVVVMRWQDGTSRHYTMRYFGLPLRVATLGDDGFGQIVFTHTPGDHTVSGLPIYLEA